MAEKKTPAKKTVAKKTVAKKPAEPKLRVTAKGKTPKDIATEKGEPWVSVLNVELDPDNIGNGAFELDWNDKFVANLVRAGYKGKTDSDMVDQWFQDVCRNVLAENYEQWLANQPNSGRTTTREDLGGGKTSVS
jgi:hypothetical protein